MDTQALAAFLEVADSASFSKAAERLFLSQPAVSKRIATLEDQLGTSLFDRVGRQITLTDAGRALLPYARRVLHAQPQAPAGWRPVTATLPGRPRDATAGPAARQPRESVAFGWKVGGVRLAGALGPHGRVWDGGMMLGAIWHASCDTGDGCAALQEAGESRLPRGGVVAPATHPEPFRRSHVCRKVKRRQIP